MKHELCNMMSLDIYLSNLTEEEYANIESQNLNGYQNIMPLLSWDVYSHSYTDALKSIRREHDIEQIRNFAQDYSWKNTVDAIFKNETFEALVLTDIKQNIVWVNNGFTQMTGYSKKEVLNRTPYFLQGPKTSPVVKDRIRQNLTGIEPFKEIIRNYKKNSDAYNCEVKIFPLYNEKTTHYLALEKRVV